MSNQPYRRHLRNYLLDRTFQLQYTLVIVLTSAVLTAGLGYFWYDEMRTASNIVEVQALGQFSLSESDVNKVEGELERANRRRLLVLIAFGAILAMALAAYGIVFTHRVAGPLFKAKLLFKAVAEGRFEPVRDLRKGDQLREFWSEFKQMQDVLRDRAAADVAAIDALARAADNAQIANDPKFTELTQAVAVLQKLREAKQASVGEAGTKESAEV